MAAAKMLYEVKDGIARITLNRPDEANPVDVEGLKLLHDYVIEADEDPSGRRG